MCGASDPAQTARLSWAGTRSAVAFWRKGDNALLNLVRLSEGGAAPDRGAVRHFVPDGLDPAASVSRRRLWTLSFGRSWRESRCACDPGRVARPDRAARRKVLGARRRGGDPKRSHPTVLATSRSPWHAR